MDELKQSQEPSPFQEIDTAYLNDMTDSSSIELDGIMLASANSWIEDEAEEIQIKIHDTIRRAAQILTDYRDGKLIYRE